jgi:DNA-binding Xre family transcriptional regulator
MTPMKKILSACKLKQPQLVEITGISLDRVKNLSSGRVQGFTKEEAQALVEKLHVSDRWLATEEGDVLQTSQEQEFYRRLAGVKKSAQGANVDGLTDRQKTTLQQILFAHETGITDSLRDLLADTMSADEKMLLERYRASPQAVKDAALRVVLVGGDSPATKINQQFNAPSEQVAGRNIIINKLGVGDGKKGKTGRQGKD